MPDPTNFEDALYAILSAAAPVTTLLGASPPAIYPDRAPDNASGRYVVYQLVSGTSDQAHDTPASLTVQRFQIDCISHASSKDAKLIAKAVRTALHGYKGTIAGVRVEHVNAFDGPADFSETSKGYRRIVEIEVMFAEP